MTWNPKDGKTPIVLEAGQVWRVYTGFIQIVQLGKTLAHYKHSKTQDQRGVSVSLAQASEVAALLSRGEATLVTAPATSKP